MSYGIYTDAALTRLTSETQPKWFLMPLAGGTKISTVYLGDPLSHVMSGSAPLASFGSTGM